MNIIFKFLVLYLSINFALFIAQDFFAIKYSLHPLLIQIIILVTIFLIIKKGLIKSNKIFALLLFYILGGIVFFVSIFGAIYFLYIILLSLYFILAAFFVWRGKVRKFFWVLLLILAIQICTLFIPSKKCNLRYKGGIVYSCDCKGFKKANVLSDNCVGKRTCYKYDEHVRWINNDQAVKQEADCFEIDNYEVDH